MRRTGLAVAAVLLAGCAMGGNLAPVEQRVVVPGAGFSAVRGEADLVVRTHVVDAGDVRREVTGATCAVTSSLYSTSLVTPARLVVPNFGPQSPELAFDCRAGNLRGQAVRDISTTWRYAPGAPYPYPYAPYGWPGLYGGYGWGYGWADRPAYPSSDYRSISVQLR